jgi:hypothetical protein
MEKKDIFWYNRQADKGPGGARNTPEHDTGNEVSDAP